VGDEGTGDRHRCRYGRRRNDVRGVPLELNDVFLRRGRWPDAARPDEVLASEMFCESHGLDPGEHIGAIINGRVS
jgi:hypothetical protein